MKRLITIFALFLFTSVPLYAQAAPDAAELTRLLNEFLAGAGRNDAAVHDRFWAEDLIYTRSAGTRTNKADLMKGVRSAPPLKPGDPVTVYTAEDIKIQQYGNAAVVAFKLVGNTTKADGTKSVSNHLNTGTFIKRSGKWQVVAWQATTVPNPDAEAKAEAERKAGPATPPNAPKPAAVVSTGSASAKTVDGRTYLKGSRGGCYYLNSSGNKVYVDKGLCN
ncbi:MAG TPA: nuclear transport factor 2 family protein [Pyrinomonadaceae bacterium]|nr:nuclear transport factor 2 family protein [Acidobacteriota bacterium]HQZ94705.1 nuclear transport factor 2 family protein [Pyrinomonadaceae bacterium]